MSRSPPIICRSVSRYRSNPNGKWFHQVSNWARMAFFMYGGEAQYSLAPGSVGLRNPAVGGSFASPVTGGASSLSSSVVYSPSTGVQSVGYAAPLSGEFSGHLALLRLLLYLQFFYVLI